MWKKKENKGKSRDDYNKEAEDWRNKQKQTHVKGRSEKSSTESNKTEDNKTDDSSTNTKTNITDDSSTKTDVTDDSSTNNNEDDSSKVVDKKRKKKKRNKPGTVVSRGFKNISRKIKTAVWKAGKRRYSRRRIRRGGTKCPF